MPAIVPALILDLLCPVGVVAVDCVDGRGGVEGDEGDGEAEVVVHGIR